MLGEPWPVNGASRRYCSCNLKACFLGEVFRIGSAAINLNILIPTFFHFRFLEAVGKPLRFFLLSATLPDAGREMRKEKHLWEFSGRV